jgi:sugar phosphate isomerase/epimerase
MTHFAFCNEMFGDLPFPEAFRIARDLGYTGIEIAPFTLAKDARDITPERRRDVRALAESLGQEIIGLHWLLAKTEGYYLTTPDPEVRRRTGEYLGILADLCADLGGSLMVLGSPVQRNLLPGVTHEQAMLHAADTIRLAEPALRRRGVTLALEPLGPAEGNFLNTARSGIELARMIDSPQVRLHLDVKAMSTEATPIPEILRESAPWLAHFHANDPNLLGPGMGDVDFAPIGAALREIGYDGWVSVEVFDYSPGPERILAESMACLRRCLQETPPPSA